MYNLELRQAITLDCNMGVLIEHWRDPQGGLIGVIQGSGWTWW